MVKIVDISKALGISIGTVDRALHDRPGIRPSTRRRVLEAAKAMGYRPNLAASVLSSKRRIRISINLPKETALFYDEVRAGIKAEHEALTHATVELEHRSFPRLGVGEVEAFEAALQANVQGIIAAVGHPLELQPVMRKASRRNIPVVTAVTGAPGMDQLAAVSIDPAVSGGLAAELMAAFLRTEGKIVVETGDLRIWEHDQKVGAFRKTIERLFPGLEVLPPMETHEKQDVAYKKMLALVDAHPDLVGCYVSTVNSLPVIRALKARRLLGKISMVTTDVFPQLVPHIQSGAIKATLYQRPRVQGQVALRTLYGFIQQGVCASDRTLLQPHIVMRSNVHRFVNL